MWRAHATYRGYDIKVGKPISLKLIFKRNRGALTTHVQGKCGFNFEPF